MARLVSPSAASSATRRSAAVSDSTPLNCNRRGRRRPARAPRARGSRDRARRTRGRAPCRPEAPAGHRRAARCAGRGPELHDRAGLVEPGRAAASSSQALVSSVTAASGSAAVALARRASARAEAAPSGRRPCAASDRRGRIVRVAGGAKRADGVQPPRPWRAHARAALAGEHVAVGRGRAVDSPRAAGPPHVRRARCALDGRRGGKHRRGRRDGGGGAVDITAREQDDGQPGRAPIALPGRMLGSPTAARASASRRAARPLEAGRR